jgi:mannose-1-phosphate guanylyltransferase
MYAFAPRVIDDITGPDPRDIGFHLLPKLIGRARTVALNGSYFLDIGTPEALRRARDDWEGRTES